MTPVRRSRYLPLIAFALLLAAPPWATTVVIGTAIAAIGLRIARRLVNRAAQPSPTSDQIPLGVDRGGRPVFISERELSAHALILGASGSGKTTTLITVLNEQIRRDRPIVAIDMKGSPAFAAQLADAAAAAGRPFKLWTPDGPSRWNPLRHGNATELKDKLICTERFTEPHYQRAAERYVQTVLQVLEQAHPDRAPTLSEVVALMDPRRLPAALHAVERPLAARVLDYRAGLTSDQLSAIRGLQTRLAILTESHAGQYLEPGGGDAVDLRSALEGPEVVLFSLNSSRYGQLAAQIGTLVVQDLICAAGGRLAEHGSGHPLEQATIAIDESAPLGESVIALFARCREAGIGVLACTQEMADYDRAGRAVRDQVLGNTAVKIVLRQDVPDSAYTIAQIAGTEKHWEVTKQIGGSIFTGYPGRGTRREVEKFVIHPNEIKSLRTGDAVLISKLRGEKARTISVRPVAGPARPPGAESTRPPGAGPTQPAPRGRRDGRSGPELG